MGKPSQKVWPNLEKDQRLQSRSFQVETINKNNRYFVILDNGVGVVIGNNHNDYCTNLR